MRVERFQTGHPGRAEARVRKGGIPLARRLAGHLVAGTLTGVLAAFADLGVALFHGSPHERREVLSALPWSLLLDVPVYTLGALLWAGFLALGALPSRLRESAFGLFALQRGFRVQPQVSADAWLGLGAAALIAVVEARAVLVLQARVHRAENAAYGAAVTSLVLCVLSAVLLPRGRRLLEALFTRFPWAARPRRAPRKARDTVGAYAFRVRYAPPEWYRASTPYWLWLPVVGSFVYASVLWAQRKAGRVRLRLLLSGLVPVCGLLISAFAYGRAHGPRALIEEHAPSSRVLIRFLRRATDWDRDGYARFFGGGDCDDTRGDVHPTAPDEPGDGIDADCFDGDGTRPYPALHQEVPSPISNLPVQPNILLISVDALRFDRLGCGGYSLPTSPNIDQLCERAWVFQAASAAAPRSVRSIPAMLTGLYPAQIPYGDENVFPSLRDEALTIPELLPPGYRKGADIGSRYFGQVRGLFQGVDERFISAEYKPPRAEPVDHAITRMREFVASGRPFFEWVHLFDVHEPTLADGAPSRFGDDLAGRYDTEVSIADGHVGRLLAALDQLQIARNTVVVVASDHGEALGEHGAKGHSSGLYEEQIHSTLILAVPGLEPRKIAEPVSAIDLAPTLAQLAGAAFPEPIAGRSLLRFGLPAAPLAEPVFAEVLPDGAFPWDVRMIRVGRYKLLYYPQAQRVTLFDLQNDPSELHDIADDHAELSEQLRADLLRWIAATHRAQFDRSAVIRAAIVPSVPPQLANQPAFTFDGAITFLGAELLTPRVRRNEVVRFALYFRAEDTTSRDLFFHVHPMPLEGPGTSPEFRLGHYPVGGLYHTHQWQKGQLVRDEVSMRVPPDLPPFRAHYVLRATDANRFVDPVSQGTSRPHVDLFDLMVLP